MPDYRAMIDEMVESARLMRGDDEIPFRLAIGTRAYFRLRQILDYGRDAGLPNAYGSVSRSLLMMSGLPITVEEKWPPNMWAVLDRKGNAIQGGILNEPPKDDPDAQD